MANLNKCLFIGRLTRDPEARDTKGGKVTSFGMAINRPYKDKDGNKQEDVCFIDFVAFGRVADIVNDYAKKGKELFVEGHMNLNKWEDKDSGEQRAKLQCIVDGVQLLGGQDSEGESKGGRGYKKNDGPF